MQKKATPKIFPQTRSKARAKAKVIKEQMGTTIYVLPNLLTTGNMFFGFMSILKTIQGDYLMASYAIVTAAVFDLLDGRVARMTNSTSKFGAEYDSLSDLVSFGVAPGLMLYYWSLQAFGRAGYLLSFFYIACGALRLARFNVQIGEESNTHFSGLPIPMAAGISAGSVMAFQDLGWEANGNKLILFTTFLLGFVMVSNFPYRSFKDLDLRKKMPFRSLVLGVLVFAIIAYRPEVMIFVLFLTYAGLGAIFGILRIGRQPKKNPYLAKTPAAADAYEEEEEEEDEELEEHDSNDHEELEIDEDDDQEDLDTKAKSAVPAQNNTKEIKDKNRHH